MSERPSEIQCPRCKNLISTSRLERRNGVCPSCMVTIGGLDNLSGRMTYSRVDPRANDLSLDDLLK